jgi:hypothetical protein
VVLQDVQATCLSCIFSAPTLDSAVSSKIPDSFFLETRTGNQELSIDVLMTTGYCSFVSLFLDGAS